MPEPIEAVRVSQVSKRFGGTLALENVDMVVQSGTIHGIVGENGAGKTTLMRILYGVESSDTGSIKCLGVVRSGHDVAPGIGMVSQHYGIIPGMSCLQNLILGAEAGPLLNLQAVKKRANELADRMGFKFDWEADSENLSPARAQKLEILKLLWRESRLMILDEPTAMLSPRDSEALFESLARLVKDGATVLLVTHRIPEVMRYCSHVTVLRGGKTVADCAVIDTNPSELAELIVGKPLDAPIPRTPIPGSERLRLEKVETTSRPEGMPLNNISFSLNSGEILGIAGVDGSGQRELIEVIAGIRPLAAGTLGFDGLPHTTTTPSQRLTSGLRLIPEDRLKSGAVEGWSLVLNGGLGLQSLPDLSKQGWRNLAAWRAIGGLIADKFQTRHSGIDKPFSTLSGGNQQRFVAGRALAVSPKLILAFQPTRGLDLNGVRQVYDGLRETTNNGAAALVISFDLDELLTSCDRILVMFDGTLWTLPEENKLDREAIGRLMVGIH